MPMSAPAASNSRDSGSSSFLTRGGDSQLDRLRDRVDYLQERVGSDAALQRHVEAVLTQTLRQSSAGRPEEMAAILAPAVMTALQDEIRYSPAAVADLLQPLARPMAVRIISSIMGEFARMAGDALRWLVSPWRWLRSGLDLPYGDEPGATFIVRDCLLIHRATGLLVAREPISADQGRTVDADFVAGATASIVSFVRRAYSDQDTGGPSVLSFGGRHWMVRAGMDEILAFSYSGTEPTGLSQRLVKIGLWLEGSWGREIRNAAGPLPVDRERAICRDLHGQLAAIGQKDERPRKPTWRQLTSRWVLAACVVAVVSLATVWRLDVARTDGVQEMLVSMVEGQPDLLGYPVLVNFDRATDHIQLKGLMPSREVAESTVKTLTQATGYPVVRMFSILSGDRLGTDGRPMAEVMGDLGSNVRTLGDELSILADSVAQSERANADWRRVQTDRLGKLAAQVAPPLPAEGQGPGNILAAWGLTNPISVDLGAWAVDAALLDGVPDLALKLTDGQFIGLRPLTADGPSDPAAVSQALQLVREHLVARGIADEIIVSRQPADGAVTEEQGDGADGQLVTIRLEVVDLSRL